MHGGLLVLCSPGQQHAICWHEHITFNADALQTNAFKQNSLVRRVQVGSGGPVVPPAGR